MKRRKRTPPRRRNVYAALVRRYGHRIEASAKAYKRNPKHRNPRQPHDGGFDLEVGLRLSALPVTQIKKAGALSAYAAH